MGGNHHSFGAILPTDNFENTITEARDGLVGPRPFGVVWINFDKIWRRYRFLDPTKTYLSDADRLLRMLRQSYHESICA